MLTREKLDKLHELSDAVEAQQELASELMRTAKDRSVHEEEDENGEVKKIEKEYELEREGKKITLKESVLWSEVFYLGVKSQAGDILKAQYPEVFEAYKKQDECVQTLKTFCIQELGVDYSKLTLSDYLRLTEGLFSLLIEERK